MTNPKLNELIAKADALSFALADSAWGLPGDSQAVDDLITALRTATNQVEVLASLHISNYIEAVEFSDMDDYQSWYHDEDAAWLKDAVRIAESSLKAIGVEDTEAYIETERKNLNENRFGREDEDE